MIYDVARLWIWLLPVAPLGLLAGWMSISGGAHDRWLAGSLVVVTIALCVGLVLAGLHWLPGRSGFRLETALLFFGGYVAFGLAGGFLRREVLARASRTR